MSTIALSGLAQLLESLSVSNPTSQVNGAEVLFNPLDICRSSLATLLANILGCEIHGAYRSIQWPNNIFNGDLSVTLPKLDPSRKPTELSSELIDKVRYILQRYNL
jgi:arginyl-tRNA synthetase